MRPYFDVKAFFSDHVPSRMVSMPVGCELGLDGLRGQRALLLSGIARPEKFFATLDGMGCRLVGRHAYPDHHRYTADEIMRLCEAAHEKGAVPVTTEKDHVRLPEEARRMVEVLRVRLVWSDPAALDRLLATLPEGR